MSIGYFKHEVECNEALNTKGEMNVKADGMMCNYSQKEYRFHLVEQSIDQTCTIAFLLNSV